jgi:hypothetical protein
MHQTGYRFAAEIHKRAWPGQQQLLAAHFADAYSCLALPVVEVDRMKPGEVIQALEANVVAITDISLTRGPQPDNKLHEIWLPSSWHRMLELDHIDGQTFEWPYFAFRQSFHLLIDFGTKVPLAALATHHRGNTFNNYQILSPAEIHSNLFLG